MANPPPRNTDPKTTREQARRNALVEERIQVHENRAERVKAATDRRADRWKEFQETVRPGATANKEDLDSVAVGRRRQDGFNRDAEGDLVIPNAKGRHSTGVSLGTKIGAAAKLAWGEVDGAFTTSQAALGDNVGRIDRSMNRAVLGTAKLAAYAPASVGYKVGKSLDKLANWLKSGSLLEKVVTAPIWLPIKAVTETSKQIGKLIKSAFVAAGREDTFNVIADRIKRPIGNRVEAIQDRAAAFNVANAQARQVATTLDARSTPGVAPVMPAVAPTGPARGPSPSSPARPAPTPTATRPGSHRAPTTPSPATPATPAAPARPAAAATPSPRRPEPSPTAPSRVATAQVGLTNIVRTQLAFQSQGQDPAAQRTSAVASYSKIQEKFALEHGASNTQAGLTALFGGDVGQAVWQMKSQTGPLTAKQQDMVGALNEMANSPSKDTFSQLHGRTAACTAVVRDAMGANTSAARLRDQETLGDLPKVTNDGLERVWSASETVERGSFNREAAVQSLADNQAQAQALGQDASRTRSAQAMQL